MTINRLFAFLLVIAPLFSPFAHASEKQDVVTAEQGGVRLFDKERESK